MVAWRLRGELRVERPQSLLSSAAWLPGCFATWLSWLPWLNWLPWPWLLLLPWLPRLLRLPRLPWLSWPPHYQSFLLPRYLGCLVAWLTTLSSPEALRLSGSEAVKLFRFLGSGAAWLPISADIAH